MIELKGGQKLYFVKRVLVCLNNTISQDLKGGGGEGSESENLKRCDHDPKCAKRQVLRIHSLVPRLSLLPRNNSTFDL